MFEGKPVLLGNRQALKIEHLGLINESELCYYKEHGIWWLYLPGCGTANLSNHQVTENEDGTITAFPSILTQGHHQGEKTVVHGYLENGKWRDA